MAVAHVYRRNHINTDEIIPARYLTTDDPRELARHCLEDLDPEFVKKVRPGDVLVAGADFGCGSSREHAVWALREAKVAAVIASSFARIFYRNAINCGFPVLELPGAPDSIGDGDRIAIDYRAGLVHNETQGKQTAFRPLPAFALAILADGGLLAHIKKSRST
jgi:3-isopropylmalate/(R)-2-methylmalate dehydratase small subunit